jgi:hypothetical protein
MYIQFNTFILLNIIIHIILSIDYLLQFFYKLNLNVLIESMSLSNLFMSECYYKNRSYIQKVKIGYKQI